MIKYLSLIFFLLIPSPLPALNQKECEAFYKTANNEFQAAFNYFRNANNQPVETKINYYNASIHHLFAALNNVNIIINHVNSVKNHKRLVWHREAKELSLKLQRDCITSIQNLQKELVSLNIRFSLEQKQKDIDLWITFSKLKENDMKFSTGEAFVQAQNEGIYYLKAAASHIELLLQEINAVTDPETIQYFCPLKDNLQNSLKNLEAQVNAFMSYGFFVAGNQKFKEALDLQDQIFTSSLKDIDKSHNACEKGIQLLEEALAEYKKALTYQTSDQNILNSQIIHVEETIRSYIPLLNLSQNLQIQTLKEHLERLSGLEESLATKRKKEAILNQLVDFDEGDIDQLTLIREQIQALEAYQVEEIAKTNKSIDNENFYQIEDKRRKDFFELSSSYVLSDTKAIPNSTIPFIVALDVEFEKNEEDYTLFLDHFYHFYVHNHALSSSITIDVYEENAIVHTECLSIPKTSDSDWYDYVICSGLVAISETDLTTKYGLHLHLISIPGSDEKNSLILKHKGENPNYRFAFSLDDSLLYKCSFISSPPWQVEFLSKFSNNPVKKPLEKINPSIDLNATVHLDALSSDPIFDRFLEEMKNDPLLIAQYVQNEIELVDPFVKRENSIFKAPGVYRSILSTFLGKQGSPWEQCILLVHLLRKAGFKALYAQGNLLSLQADYFEKLLMTKVPGEREVTVEYPWVLFFDGNQWITLFPWMKDIHMHEGLDLYDFMPAEYASADKWIKRYLMNDPKIMQYAKLDENDTTAVLFVRFLEEELKKHRLSLQDVGMIHYINKKQFVSWHDFPRTSIASPFQVSIGLPENVIIGLQIEIASRENPQKKIIHPLTAVLLFNTNPCKIDFEPIDETSHFLHFKGPESIFKEKKRSLRLDASDQNIDIKVILSEDDSKTFTMAKGTSAALCFNSGGSNSKLLSYFGEYFSKATDEKSKIHALLAFMGALYFDKCCRAEKILANLHKRSPSTYIQFGLSKLSPDLSQGRVAGRLNLAFPQVDMFSFHYFKKEKFNKFTFPYHQDIDLAERQFIVLKCCDVSSNEHQVLREIFHDPYAISTVKLLQIAHERHQKEGLFGPGFLSFTQKTIDEAEKMPILAQCLYFNHLKDLNLSKIRFQAGSQWTTASLCLNTNEKNGPQDFSYVYMTPGSISSKDGDDLRPPSYTGVGTLIIHKNGYQALISNGSNVMNGGYGSRLPNGFLESFAVNDWKIVPKNNSFSLISPGLSQIFNEVNTFEKSLFTSNLERTFFDPKTYHFQTKNISLTQTPDFTLTQTSDFKSDIRSLFKGLYHTVSDPVDIVSGAFYVDAIDLTLPGPFSLEIRRNYNNQNPINGPLGFGWKLSLNPYLVEKEDHLFASEEDGTVIDYRFNPSHACWEVLPEDNLELGNQNKKGIGGTANPYHAYIEVKDQKHILYGSDGSKRKFKNKQLEEWTDHGGNSLFFTFDQDQLIRVENAQGGFLGFCYNHEGRISEAYTKDGRRVYYTYDCAGNLVSVELPNGAQITYEYDDKHQVIKEAKPHGLCLENSYDEFGRVVKQCSPNGIQQQMVVTAKFTYGDHVTTVTDAAGSCTEYKIYQKQIYKITDPEGNQILQSTFIDANSWFDAETEQVKPWNEKGSYPRSLKSSKDKRGLITEYLYDERGNLIDITLKGNDLTGNGDKEIKKKMAYNEHNLCIIEETLNRKTLITYDPLRYLPTRIEKYCGETPISWMAFQYNSYGQMASKEDSGAITLWEYDHRGFPIKKISKTGTEDPDVITTFHYNHQGQCIEEISSDTIIKNDYDIMGNPLVFSLYDGSGKLVSTKYNSYNLNNAPMWQIGLDPNDIVQIDYNFAGLPKMKRHSLTQASVVDSQVQIQKTGAAYTLYDYDERGHLIQEVDPLGHCTYREYDRLGRISKISKMNISTQFRYETGGFVSETLFPNGAKVSKEYSSNGLLTKEIYPDSESIYKYDLFGRPIFETKNGITLTIEYDDALNKIIHRQQGVVFKIEEYNLKGHLIAITDSEGNTGKKTYDDLGRLKSDTDPEGNQTTWHYHANTITCTLPSGEKTLQSYAAGKVVESQTFDPEGNLIARILSEYSPHTSSFKEISEERCLTTWMNTQGKAIAIEQGGMVTINHYDPSGQCVATIDGEGRMTQRQYDLLGRLKQKTLSGGRVILYEYDANSNLTNCTLPNGVLWKASYDLMGKKLSEELQASGLTSQQWKYTYEQGRLKEAIDPNQRKHIYFYDIFGRNIEEQVGNDRRHYTYDLTGSLIAGEQITEDHTKLERSYDKSGRLISEVTYLNGQLIQNTQQVWMPSKRTLQINDHTRSYKYLGGRLSQITTPAISLNYRYHLNGSLLSHSTKNVIVDYQYHPSGLPKMITTQIDKKQFGQAMEWDKSAKMSIYASNWKDIQEEKRFTYNSQAQLRSVNNDHYVFDFAKPGCGVLTQSPHGTVSTEGLDPFGKIISEFNEDRLIVNTYNAIGEVISRVSKKNTQKFKWDSWGNLIQISTDDDLWKASYDILGRRLQTQYSPKIGQSQTTLSFYDPEKEFDEIGVKFDGKTYWKFGNSKCEAIVDDAGNSVSLVYDAFESLIAVVHSEEVHWNQELRTPYGPRGPPAILKHNLTSLAFAHAWQGRRADPTGFIWMGARYYDPIVGRFLSADPVGIPISLDLYSYANGDPINFNDPDGRFSSAVYDKTPSRSIHEPPLPKIIYDRSYEKKYSPGNRSRRHDLSYLGRPELPNGDIIMLVNGIANPFSYFEKSMIHLSDLSGGYNVHGVYSVSMGFSRDIMTYLLANMFIDTGPVPIILEEWHDHFKKNSEGRVLMYSHSRGAVDARNASLACPEEYKKYIHHVAIAPGAYIYRRTCAEVTHYRVPFQRDFIPYLDCEGAAREKDTIIELSCHEDAAMHDHGILSPTYRRVIKDEAKNFISNKKGRIND